MSKLCQKYSARKARALSYVKNTFITTTRGFNYVENYVENRCARFEIIQVVLPLYALQ